MKIEDVVLFRVNGHYIGSGYPFYDRSCGWLDIYPEFNAGAHIPRL